MGSLLSLGAAVPAWAKDDKPVSVASSKSVRSMEASLLRDALWVWNTSVKAYKAAVTAREKAMQMVNEAFTKSVQRAKFDLAAALARAGTPTEQMAAQARFREALDRATSQRQAAIEDLPELPPAPGPKPTLKSLRSPPPTPTPTD